VAARGARQQAQMPAIGFLHSQSPDTNADRLRGFHRGLKDSGYVEGENVTIVYRWAENQIDRLPALAVDLVRRQVSVITTLGGTASALAVKAYYGGQPIEPTEHAGSGKTHLGSRRGHSDLGDWPSAEMKGTGYLQT
jgi:ABC-type uncharacterized transport system substrate-binding protein